MKPPYTIENLQAEITNLRAIKFPAKKARVNGMSQSFVDREVKRLKKEISKLQVVDLPGLEMPEQNPFPIETFTPVAYKKK